jgi:drug/metabolite transporter (DMT)-like permease
LAGIIFGTAGVFTRSIDGIAPVGIAANRLLIGFICMGILIWKQESLPELKRSYSHYPLFFLLGGISSLHFLLFVIAIQKTFIANALILVNTAPILVLLLAPVFLKETITRVDMISVIITFFGAGLLVGLDKIILTPAHLIGDVCALGSALCYALYVIIARKLRAVYSSQTIMFWFFGLGAALLFLGGLIHRKPFFASPSRTSIIFLILLGIFPTGIGHFLYNLSLKYIPAAKASTIILLEPVTGTLFAFLFLEEIPPLSSFIGILIALCGISLVSITHVSGKQ